MVNEEKRKKGLHNPLRSPFMTEFTSSRMISIPC